MQTCQDMSSNVAVHSSSTCPKIGASPCRHELGRRSWYTHTWRMGPFDFRSTLRHSWLQPSQRPAAHGVTGQVFARIDLTHWYTEYLKARRCVKSKSTAIWIGPVFISFSCRGSRTCHGVWPERSAVYSSEFQATHSGPAPDKQTHLPPSCAKAPNELLSHFLLGEYRLRVLGTSKAYSGDHSWVQAKVKPCPTVYRKIILGDDRYQQGIQHIQDASAFCSSCSLFRRS